MRNFLQECAKVDDKDELNLRAREFLKEMDHWNILDSGDEQLSIEKRISVWKLNLKQIIDSHTLERSRYYINRMNKGLTLVSAGKINDIDFGNWKEYDDIITDSLWLFDKRDRTNSHSATYWGNFVPQIPNQLIRRFTKKGDTILDAFLGSGTTAIESMVLGRNCIGVDISQKAIDYSTELTNKGRRNGDVFLDLVKGDSANIDLQSILDRHGKKNVQLCILHPPYWDIIKFNDEKNNLSGAKTIEEFRKMFSKVLSNVLSVLENGRYLAIVIGDSYKGGEWFPIGFYLMNDSMNLGLKLKSVVVKNYSDTRAKRSSSQLWRYRALRGNFYVFKHEYIFIMQKPEK